MIGPVGRFIAVVKEYCAWAEGTPGSKSEEVETAIRLVANLYASALLLHSSLLDLPDPNPADNVDDNYRISHSEWTAIHKRFGALPFNYYHVFSSPTKLKTGRPEEAEAVIGDLADDLADIYRDLKEGLLLYENGRIAEAIWHWNHDFYAHWGEHASSALYALHSYDSENEDEYNELMGFEGA